MLDDEQTVQQVPEIDVLLPSDVKTILNAISNAPTTNSPHLTSPQSCVIKLRHKETAVVNRTAV